jgi:hypothetical protein
VGGEGGGIRCGREREEEENEPSKAKSRPMKYVDIGNSTIATENPASFASTPLRGRKGSVGFKQWEKVRD